MSSVDSTRIPGSILQLEPDQKPSETTFKPAQVVKQLDYIKAGQHRAAKFAEVWAHNSKLYTGQAMAKPSTPIRTEIDSLNVNEVYGNIEVNMAAIGFKSPRFHVKADQNKVYVINQMFGNEYELADSFSPDILKMMEMTGQTSVQMVGQDGRPVSYTVLDGADSARLVDAALNKWAVERDIEMECNAANIDALMAGLGCVWIQYEDNILIPHSKLGGEIYCKHTDLRRDIVFDPFLRDPKNLNTEGRFVSRRFSFTPDYWQELFECNRDFFIEGAFMNFMECGAEETLKVKDGPFPVDSYGDTFNEVGRDDQNQLTEKRKIAWASWIKPTPYERMKGGIWKNGKIALLSKGCHYPIAFLPWGSKMDGFPCELLWYNAPLNGLYPVSDIKVYEGILAEKNYMRGIQRRLAEQNALIKIIGDFTDTQIQDRIKENRSGVYAMPGFSKDKIQQLILGQNGSKATEFNNQIEYELQKVSLIADSQKGLVPESRVSATAISEQSRSQNSRQSSRVHIFANFYKRIGRKAIQLMQQNYKKNRMILISGSMNPEWTESFNQDAIQGEYSTFVDVMSMNPADEILMRQSMTDLFNLQIGMFKDPNVHLKLISEGYEPNLSENFREILRRNNVTTDKIFPKIPDNLKGAASIRLMENLGVIPPMPAPGAVPGQVPGVQGGAAPADASLMGELPTNVSPMNGVPLNPGSVMPPGGVPKT